LSRIRDRDDVDRVIAHGVKQGIITPNGDDICSLESINANVKAPIMDPDSLVWTWFDPDNRVYSERTITMASTSLWDDDGIANVRPDRIVRRPDGTILVIDYKSGERNDAHYLRQLQGYIDKLRLVFPDAPIAGYIWYVGQRAVLDHRRRLSPIRR